MYGYMKEKEQDGVYPYVTYRQEAQIDINMMSW
jgi:hypothetical protein